MLGAESLTSQPSLFDTLTTTKSGSDMAFDGDCRLGLDETAWVDHVPGWLQAPDQLFEWLLTNAPRQACRSATTARPVGRQPVSTVRSPTVLEQMQAQLCAHYGRRFDSVGVNLLVLFHLDRAVPGARPIGPSTVIPRFRSPSISASAPVRLANR